MPISDTFRIYKDQETMLKVYQRRVNMADRMFDKHEAEKNRYTGRYDNDAEEDQVTSRGHRVSVTKGVGVIDTMYSSMVAVDIEFILRQVGHGTPEQALAAERGLNQAWHDTKGGEETADAIKDALLVDAGWVKVYYDYAEDIDIRDVPDAALRAQVEELLGAHPHLTTAELQDLLQVTEEVTVVLRDRVCIDYVPWDMIRVDPSAKRMKNARWVAQYTRLPLEEVRNHPVWRPFAEDRYGVRKAARMLDDINGDSSVLSGMAGDYADIEAIGLDEHEDDQRVTIVEFWDFETGLVTTFPKGNLELVLYQRLNPLMFNMDLQDRNPFKMLTVRDTSTKLEGNGDMRVIYPSLQELDDYRKTISQYVERAKAKVLGPERALTARGMTALQSQEDFAYVGLQEGVGHQEIGTLKLPELPEVAFSMPERIAQEMEEATGVSEPMRGVFPSRRTTATETNIVTTAGEQRQSERRMRLERWYLSIARTMLQLMQVFYDRDRMLRFTDDLGQEFVWTWNKEDIAVDADLRIALTPRENLTRDQRIQRLNQFINLALPLPETDRGQLLMMAGREMGYRDDEIRRIVKTDREVQVEQQQEQVSQQLAVAPQAFGNAPAGLAITPKG